METFPHQKKLSPLRNKSLTSQDIVFNPRETAPSSSIVVPLSIMTTVEEKEKTEKDSEFNGSDADTTFWSRKIDPTATRPQDLEGLSKLRPSTQQQSPACRHFKDQKRRENTTSGSSIIFPEGQLSTSWTEFIALIEL